MSLVGEARDNGLVSGRFMELALSIERHLAVMKGKPVPMNIDGATAVIFAELGFAPPLARGCSACRVRLARWRMAMNRCSRAVATRPTPPHYRWRYAGNE